VIRAIAKAVPDAVLGVGTVMDRAQAAAALEAGARFLVSPGVTPALAEVAANCSVPFLPGIATVSEAMRLREMGFMTLKFFPAESSGGIAALRCFRTSPSAPRGASTPARRLPISPCPTSSASAAPGSRPLGWSRAGILPRSPRWLAPHRQFCRHEMKRVTGVTFLNDYMN
jgi:2-dehydro-3-deoxyphosphogluconate aldolase/(4S)-4-hydroxy-2-oxoglutarate aldolase